MKLKKIASLALAGVMAVSMLAGCAGKTGTTDDGTTVVVTPSSTAASVFNDTMDPSYPSITFTNSTALADALEKAAVAVYPYNNTNLANNVLAAVVGATGIKNGVAAAPAATDFFGQNGKCNGVDAKDGASMTKLFVATYDAVATGVWTEEAAIQKTADVVKNLMSGLYEDTYQDGVTKTSYMEYSYSGEVASVTVKSVGNTTYYYVAYTITQNVSEVEV